MMAMRKKKKAPEEVKAPEKVETPPKVAEAPKATEKKEKLVPMYKTNKGRVIHPIHRITISTERPIPCPRDSWLDVQINAGIVVEC